MISGPATIGLLVKHVTCEARYTDTHALTKNVW